jgi:hypothetical protein
MEREHLIIIVLILVALFVINKDNKDEPKTVCAWGPMGRIRTTEDGSMGPLQGSLATHIRSRRGDRDYGQGHFIKNHIRRDNRNAMFSAMMTGEIGPDNVGQSYSP